MFSVCIIIPNFVIYLSLESHIYRVYNINCSGHCGLNGYKQAEIDGPISLREINKNLTGGGGGLV